MRVGREMKGTRSKGGIIKQIEGCGERKGKENEQVDMLIGN